MFISTTKYWRAIVEESWPVKLDSIFDNNVIHSIIHKIYVLIRLIVNIFLFEKYFISLKFTTVYG